MLKIDVEGYEPEVEVKDTLNEIQYISVDYGNERREEDSTMCEVTNFLYENNLN